MSFDRNSQLAALRNQSSPFDVLIIGGGATGLGIAVDAAQRGYRVALIEGHDFAKGTSSRSTKLIHGGVRYLQQGNLSLVLEALKERGLLLKNAPHLVRDLPFVVPNYDFWEAPFYGFGLKLYDAMAGKLGFGTSQLLDREETLEKIPSLEEAGLRGGVLYHDGQFDDARLALNLAQTAEEQGAICVNYVRAESLLKHHDIVCGVVATDQLSGESFELSAKLVVNATGPFCDELRLQDDPSTRAVIAASQGIHIMLPRRFLPSSHAIMVPRTSDGRVIFIIPWHNCALLGTTDVAIPSPQLEPEATQAEVDFLLVTALRYLKESPRRDEIKSVFTGIRPLVSADKGSTAALSRDHSVLISKSGLVSVAGGKWTTYRKMAEDVVDQIIHLADLKARPCQTETLPIHGSAPFQDGVRGVYGSDLTAIAKLESEKPNNARLLSPELPHTEAQIRWAIRHEMAMTVEDILARRTRILLEDARIAIAIAPRIAEILIEELAISKEVAAAQVQEFQQLAEHNYLWHAPSDMIQEH